jgi:hypothetical protein
VSGNSPSGEAGYKGAAIIHPNRNIAGVHWLPPLHNCGVWFYDVTTVRWGFQDFFFLNFIY